MNKTNISLLLCLVLFGFIFNGCRDDEPAVASGEDKYYERVICMAPSITEIVFALGQGDRVVGVSDFTTYPPEADALPRCGGYMNPNFEIILSLNPDLIFTHGRPGDFQQFGKRYGIDIVPLQIDDLTSIYDSFRRIGEVLDSEKQAEELVNEMQAELDELKEQIDEGWEPVRTLMVVGRAPSSLREIHVVGPGGFLHDLLELVGGENIMGDLNRQYSSVSKEIVAQRKPELIIELHGEGMMEEQEREKYLKVWQDMETLPAVKNNNIHVIEETFAMLPGPRSVKIAERIAQILGVLD